jgi:hypothetical protein
MFFMPLMLFASPIGVVALLAFVAGFFHPDWMDRLAFWLLFGLGLFGAWAFSRK